MKIKRITKDTSKSARVEIHYKLEKLWRENEQKREKNKKKAKPAREKLIRIHENRIIRYLDLIKKDW